MSTASPTALSRQDEGSTDKFASEGHVSNLKGGYPPVDAHKTQKLDGVQSDC